VRAGLRPTTLERGTRLQAVAVGGESMAQYLSKVLDGDGAERSVSMELARSDMKEGGRGGLAPFQVLEAAANGERWAAARWAEYETVTKGRRAMESSRGLAKLTGVADVEDEDLAEEEVAGDPICLIDGRDHAAIARAGYVPAVLDIAEREDRPAVVAFIDALLRVVGARAGP
jgi:hypothetical protein